jgi:hypothetical protein
MLGSPRSTFFHRPALGCDKDTAAKESALGRLGGAAAESVL